MSGKVRVIQAKTSKPIKHLVIYARVSSNTMEQLDSLKAQISGLTRFVSGHNNWKLVDIHIDIASSKKGSARPAFHKMIEECKAGLTDTVVVKNIGRLGRDTVKVLDAINTLREAGVRIIFRQEELDTLTVGSSLLISTIEACTQAENETRSANIKWGIKQRASNGSLGFYRRKCYGYDKDENGELVINDEQAAVVTRDTEQGMLRKRIDEMRQFLQTHTNRVTEYDEQMVRRLIDKITVFDDKLIFEFKSGMMLELKR